MEEYKFTPGELIVPNEDLMAAFRYDPHNTEFIEGVEYRVATSAEFIWFSKNKGMTSVNNGIENYKKSQQSNVSAIYASIDKQKNNDKKHGLS